MKVEPISIGSASAIKRPNSVQSIATQQNNWLQNEIVQSSSLNRANGSVKSLRLQSAVVQTQPLQAQPMPIIIQDVVPVQNLVPPGLEYLANVDQLLVQQKVELIEAITG